MEWVYSHNDHLLNEQTVRDIDVVYGLALNTLTDREAAILMQIYESLPGWMGYDSHGIPCWFGWNNTERFLSASAEPSGLHVAGVLEQEQWDAWHTAFCAAVLATKLPRYEV